MYEYMSAYYEKTGDAWTVYTWNSTRGTWDTATVSDGRKARGIVSAFKKAQRAKATADRRLMKAIFGGLYHKSVFD